MRTIAKGLTCALITCSAAPAFASALPTSCQARADQRAFNGGRNSGASLVRQAWSFVHDCDRITTFTSMVRSSLDSNALPPAPNNAALCRYAGLVDGMLGELDHTFQTCSEGCLREGRFAGELSAVAYCELAIALGGLTSADSFLRIPTQVCGPEFAPGCEASFSDTTSSYQNSEGLCEPYSQSEYLEVFEQARTYQCDYGEATSS